MADRRYSDKEVGEILKIAAEMQAGLAGAGTAEGVTLEELKRVAAEVGMDPENVELAAREIRSNPPDGSRNSLLLERTLRGELTEEAWEDLVTELRRYTGKRGRTEQNGNAREWVGHLGIGSVMLSVTNQRGKTRLKLLGDGSEIAATTGVIGFGIGMFSSLGPLIYSAKHEFAMNPFLTTFLMAMMAGLAFFGTKLVNRSKQRKFALEVEALMERMGGIAESSPVNDSSLVQRLENSAVESEQPKSIQGRA